MAGRAGRGKRDGNDVVKGREAARMKSEHLLRGGTGEMFRMTMVMSATVRRIYSYFHHHILIIIFWSSYFDHHILIIIF